MPAKAVVKSRVLLVEDSKFLRLANERALSKAGFDVTTAADGEEALQIANDKLNDKLPDIILLDMLLPRLSGPEVLKALKANPAHHAHSGHRAKQPVAEERRKTSRRGCSRLFREIQSRTRQEFRSTGGHDRGSAGPGGILGKT